MLFLQVGCEGKLGKIAWNSRISAVLFLGGCRRVPAETRVREELRLILSSSVKGWTYRTHGLTPCYIDTTYVRDKAHP